MVYLSEYLEYIRNRPGMYIGRETPETLETFIVGFDAASPLDYASFMLIGSKGLSALEDFDAAFETALAAAKEAEAAWNGEPLEDSTPTFDAEAVRKATFGTEGLKERLKPYNTNRGRHPDRDDRK